MSTESSLPPDVGRYRILRELGKGAMGRVLLAEDPVLQRHVAIKHLRSDLSLAPEQRSALLERMSQEARASARVNHPHLVALFDMGEDPKLGLYLVFEYVEGPSLHERLKNGPLPVAEAAKLVRELGNALSYAHGRGIVHRDVKPENIILSPAGSKLADFGIARLPDSTLTQGTGVVLGTPAYSAPEALRGAAFSPLSDQFSLGATLYEVISGRRPFPGDDALAVAARITNDEAPRIAQKCRLDRSVDVVLARVLSKTPRMRFKNCAEFGAALSDALTPAPRAVGTVSGEAPRARHQQPTLPDQLHLQLRPQRPGMLWALVIATASAAATWAFMTFADPKPSSARETMPRESDVREENPAAVAWLAESPLGEAAEGGKPEPVAPQRGAARHDRAAAKTPNSPASSAAPEVAHPAENTGAAPPPP